MNIYRRDFEETKYMFCVYKRWWIARKIKNNVNTLSK